MPRPPKCRRVAFIPEVTYFKPAGIPLRVLEEVHVSIEEAEAIRLKDLEGLEQEQCAERMSISRPTFQRVLEAARRKIADALLNGKAIKIDGGNFGMAINHFKCVRGHEWNVPFKAILSGPPKICPTCSTAEIMSLQAPSSIHNEKSRARRLGGRHYRQ